MTLRKRLSDRSEITSPSPSAAKASVAAGTYLRRRFLQARRRSFLCHRGALRRHTGWASITSAGNQCAMDCSTNASLPCFCATAVLSSHRRTLAGVDFAGGVAHDHLVEPLRMFCAKPRAVTPPIERPANAPSLLSAHPSAPAQRRSTPRSCSTPPEPRSPCDRADRNAVPGTRTRIRGPDPPRRPSRWCRCSPCKSCRTPPGAHSQRAQSSCEIGAASRLAYCRLPATAVTVKSHDRGEDQRAESVSSALHCEAKLSIVPPLLVCTGWSQLQRCAWSPR
jgi:hypothetical protein